MLWQQGAVCFLVWIAYGWWLRSRSDLLRSKLGSWRMPSKVMMASLGFIGSGVLLLGGLAAIGSAGGLRNGSLAPWAWVATTAIGLVFVHLQVAGAGAMISIVQDEEAARKTRASNIRTAGKEQER